MANDRDRTDRDSLDRDPNKKRDRTIGEGMDSLDSTQAPLKAETGEPDWDAMEGRGNRDSDEDSDRPQSNR
jgi:hypothetical protein